MSSHTPPPCSGKSGPTVVSSGYTTAFLTSTFTLLKAISARAPGRIRTCAPGSGGR